MVERLEPPEVAVGLGGDENEVLGTVLKITSRALLALRVILLHRAEDIAAGKLHCAAPRVAAFAHDIGKEKLRRIGFHILRVNLPDDGAAAIIGGGEEVQQRVLKVDRPGDGFVPRAARGVERERGERLLEQPIVRGLMLIAVLALVEVVIDIEFAKIRAGHEGIATADEVAAHFESDVVWGCIGIVHAATMARLDAKRINFPAADATSGRAAVFDGGSGRSWSKSGP